MRTSTTPPPLRGGGKESGGRGTRPAVDLRYVDAAEGQ
jgi:hypothetical protein